MQMERALHSNAHCEDRRKGEAVPRLRDSLEVKARFCSKLVYSACC